ncbi:MAG: FAD-dependent oxidoreductase, partial [Ancrocorticia populi]|uniref:FAD-dependent oxidoreductase n=1 Tax=Ancrocorticia populi TaxID=2175228 RepID=UPI003F91A7A1
MTDPETASSRELLTADIVVCGGGLAGLCAAVAAARHGAQVILVGDRPVLGGCSSSEIRVSPQGAAHFHGYARESGIISELIIADRMVNHAATGGTGWTNSVWDMVLYDLVQRTPGITLLLNTSIDGVEMADNSRIGAVLARTAGAERRWRLAGNLYVDSTGDGVVAAMAGNAWRMGSEGRAEFGEPHAPLEPSDGVQGTSIQIMTKNVGYPIGFTAPDWAEYYDDEKFFHEGGRIPDSTRSGWWWLELGTPWDTIRDNEVIRHELTRHALGVWDWIKNRSTEYQDRFANFALDWIGQVPGKRESRRIEGRHRITEHDLLRERLTGEGSFPDEVAYGGWNIDLHTPGGLLAASSEATAAEGYRLGGSASITTAVPPFGIPLRALIARDVDNLFLAGRDISTTHVALGAVRVQGTTSLMGQAVGTAAAMLLGEEAPQSQNHGYRI